MLPTASTPVLRRIASATSSGVSCSRAASVRSVSPPTTRVLRWLIANCAPDAKNVAEVLLASAIRATAASSVTAVCRLVAISSSVSPSATT